MKRREVGYSSVVAVLSSAFLLTIVLTITASMSLSAQKVTGDQSRALTAQYAAESGISHATIKLRLVDQMIRYGNLNLSGVSATDLDSYVSNFCGSLSNSTFTPDEKANGLDTRFDTVTSCKAPLNVTNTNRFDLLAVGMTANGYKTLLAYNNPKQSADWLDQTSRQMAGETTTTGTGWTLDQRRAWWNGFLGSETLTSPNAVDFAATINIRPYAIRTYSKSGSTSMYRFMFKSDLSSVGKNINDANARRVMVASSPDDNQGIFSTDVELWTPALFLDSARSKDGFAYSGNISNLLGIDRRIPNDYSKYSDGDSNGVFANPQYFDAQFRNGIYDQETVVGDIFTNEFWTFDEHNKQNNNIKGKVSSAGCIRDPKITTTTAGVLNFTANNCLRFEQNVYGRETTNELVRVFGMQEILKKKLGSRYDNLSAADKNTLLTQQLTTQSSLQENRWDGSEAQFSNKPDFAAPFVKGFDFTSDTTSGSGLLETDLMRRRNASRGLDEKGNPTSNIGINIEDLWTKANSSDPQLADPTVPANKTRWAYAGGETPPAYFNTTVRLRATSDIDANSSTNFATPYPAVPTDTNKFTWDSIQQTYTINGGAAKYQYIEITPNYTPGAIISPKDTTSIGCGTPKPVTLRVSSDGSMEIYSYSTVISDFNMYVCDRVKLAGSGKWLPYMPGKKFNGTIYSDGNIQVTTPPINDNISIDPTTKRRPLNLLDGKYENMFPAIASFQNLEIGAGQKIHIPRDLVLENLPCTNITVCGTKSAPKNSLSLHASNNVEISNELTPVLYTPDKLATNIPAPVINNLTINAAIISSQGELRNVGNFVDFGTAGSLPMLGDLKILGSVMTKYNGQVGRYMPSTNDFRGYRRSITIDPRISSGAWLPKKASGSTKAAWSATASNGSAVPIFQKAGY